ncbi:hypothetical protein [Methylibium petroleiphilum]
MQQRARCAAEHPFACAAVTITTADQQIGFKVGSARKQQLAQRVGLRPGRHVQPALDIVPRQPVPHALGAGSGILAPADDSDRLCRSQQRQRCVQRAGCLARRLPGHHRPVSHSLVGHGLRDKQRRHAAVDDHRLNEVGAQLAGPAQRGPALAQNHQVVHERCTRRLGNGHAVAALSPVHRYVGLGQPTRRAVETMARLPQDLARRLHRARRGNLKVSIEIDDLHHDGDPLDRAASRLSLALVAAALIIGSSIVMTIRGGPPLLGLPAFGLVGFAGAVFSALLPLRAVANGRRRPDEER